MKDKFPAQRYILLIITYFSFTKKSLKKICAIRHFIRRIEREKYPSFLMCSFQTNRVCWKNTHPKDFSKLFSEQEFGWLQVTGAAVAHALRFNGSLYVFMKSCFSICKNSFFMFSFTKLRCIKIYFFSRSWHACFGEQHFGTHGQETSQFSLPHLRTMSYLN